MHAQCLHWLVSTGLLFQSAFCWPCKTIFGKMVPIAGSKSTVETWYFCHSQYTMSSPCSGILAHSGYITTCGHHGHSKLCHSCLGLSLLCSKICFWHSPNFLLISFLCFLGMHYADNVYLYIIVHLCIKNIIIGIKYELQEQLQYKSFLNMHQNWCQCISL